jgi:hypothetical protein
VEAGGRSLGLAVEEVLAPSGGKAAQANAAGPLLLRETGRFAVRGALEGRHGRLPGLHRICTGFHGPTGPRTSHGPKKTLSKLVVASLPCTLLATNVNKLSEL